MLVTEAASPTTPSKPPPPQLVVVGAADRAIAKAQADAEVEAEVATVVAEAVAVVAASADEEGAGAVEEKAAKVVRDGEVATWYSLSPSMDRSDGLAASPPVSPSTGRRLGRVRQERGELTV